MSDYLRLIRYKNLLFLLLTLWCMQRCVIEPILATYGFDAASTPLTWWQFALLACAILCIAGGGYAVNDYFDVKIDTINRPLTRIVGVSIEKRHAMLTHQILTGIGVVAGIILSITVHSFRIGIIFIFVPGMLWFYSATYKRQFFIGNIIIALCAALAVLIVPLTNAAVLRTEYPQELLMKTGIIQSMYARVGAFAIFAFALTLIREIIKDAVDQNGDREMECRTLPIVLGEKGCKAVIVTLITITTALLAFTVARYADNSLTWRYAGFGVMLPMAILAVMVAIAKQISDYRNAQQLAKYIMIIGTLYSVAFYFLLAAQKHIPFFGLMATN